MPDIRIDLDARLLGISLLRLSKVDSPIARTLISKLVRAWDPMYGPVRGDRRYCSVKLAEHEAEVYASLAIKSLLQCTYAAVYVDPKDPHTEVKVCSEKRPPVKATFNVRGGKRRLVRTSITRIMPEENHMARKTAAADADLDGLDDIDLEDDEDEAPAPKAKSKAKKAETPAEKRRRVKAEKAAAEAEEEDDEDDEDEDDEDDDDEDEPAPVKSKKSSKTAAPAKKKGKGTPVGRALPEDKFGVEQVAALAGTSGRAVRIYCRTNDIPKSEGLGRYAWTEKAATALAKKIKAGSK